MACHRQQGYQATSERQIAAAPQPASPNTLFFMAPGQVHDFVLSEDATGFTLNFSPEFFTFKTHSRQSLTDIPIYDFGSHNNALYIDQPHADILRAIVDAIIEEYAAEQNGYEDVIWSYLRIFLMKVSRMAAPNSAVDLSSRSLLLSRRSRARWKRTSARSAKQPNMLAC